MKKSAVAMVVSLMVIIGLTGCKGKVDEAELKYLKDFDPDKYVTLGQYKGVEVNVTSPSVSEESVNEYLEYYTSMYSNYVTVTDHDDVREGDIANIDYEGKKDGVAFEGGTADGYDLPIGSGTFIDGFEDGVIGMKIGETKDLNLTFPEDYGNKDLAGADVVFTVRVNSIKKEADGEIDDEFVKNNIEGFDSLEDLKNYIREDLQADADSGYENELLTAIQNKVFEGCKFKDAPSGFVNRLSDTMLNHIQSSAESYGMDPGTVASYFYGFNAENYEQEIRDYCKDTLAKQYIMMAAIAKKEKIEVTDEVVDKSIDEIIETYGGSYTREEFMEGVTDIESYRESVLVDKVMDMLVENAVVKEP